jgi:hypothetical protein
MEVFNLNRRFTQRFCLLEEERMNIEIRVANLDEIPIVHKLMLDAFEEYRLLDVPSSALNGSEEDLLYAINSGSE